MTNVSGLGQTGAEAAIDNIIEGGVDVHLCTTAVDYNDGAADIDTKSAAVQAVADTGLSKTFPASFDGAAELTNDADIEFGSQDIGEVVDVVIQNGTDGELWLVADEVNNPNLTGEEYTIEANTTLYELGNPA